MKRHGQQRGIIFVIALVSLVVMLLMGTLLIGMTTHELGTSRRALNAVHATAMADAGLNYIIWRQKWSDTDTANIDPVPDTAITASPAADTLRAPAATPAEDRVLGDMNEALPNRFRVWLFTYTDDGAQGYQVISRGDYRGYSRTVRAILQGEIAAEEETEEPPVIPPPPPIFNYALFSGTNLDLGGQGYVEGSVGTNGNFSAGGNTVVTQSINAAGAVRFSGSNVDVGGHIHYGTSYKGGEGFPNTKDGQVFPFPSINLAAWKAYAQSQNAVIDGDLNVSSRTEFTSPVVYVKGNIHFSGQSSIAGKVTLISEGTVHFSGQLESDPPPPGDKANIVIMSANGVKFTGQTNVMAVIYSHNVEQTGDFLGSGQTTVYGAVIADSVKGSGQFNIHYRQPDTWTTPPPTDPGNGNGGGNDQFKWNVASWETL